MEAYFLFGVLRFRCLKFSYYFESITYSKSCIFLCFPRNKSFLIFTWALLTYIYIDIVVLLIPYNESFPPLLNMPKLKGRRRIWIQKLQRRFVCYCLHISSTSNGEAKECLVNYGNIKIILRLRLEMFTLKSTSYIKNGIGLKIKVIKIKIKQVNWWDKKQPCIFY